MVKSYRLTALCARLTTSKQSVKPQTLTTHQNGQNEGQYRHQMKIRLRVYTQCSDSHKLITPSFEALENLKALPVKVNPGQPIVLCPSHHHKLYFKAPPCAGCGTTPKRATCFNRHSPVPITISQVLRDNAAFNDVNLSESDFICFNCYKVI